MAAQDQDGRLGFADPVLVNSAAARLRPSGFAPMAQEVAEAAARQCGWTLHGTGRFACAGLVPSYFYHRGDDILDCESRSWADLARSQPFIMATIARLNWKAA